jgi:hypothetical protein
MVELLERFESICLGFHSDICAQGRGGLTAPGTQSNRPRPFRRKFDFAGPFSVSLFTLIRGAF